MTQKTPYPTGHLFLDIETIPAYKDYDTALRENYRWITDHFCRKFAKDILEKPVQQVWQEKAALYAEFGKIVCVVVGRIDNEGNLLLKTLVTKEEKLLLEQLAEILNKGKGNLVGHNILEFDAPFMLRRMWANGIVPPESINTDGKPKWELKITDTMDMWSGSAYKYKSGLDLICHTLGIPSPKSDMGGGQVAEVWYSMYNDKGELPWDAETATYERIGAYCRNDVAATVNLYLRMKNLPIIEANKVLNV
jgi:predicted PolB exonuclease-like 3'-5' exonuclease